MVGASGQNGRPCSTSKVSFGFLCYTFWFVYMVFQTFTRSTFSVMLQRFYLGSSWFLMWFYFLMLSYIRSISSKELGDVTPESRSVICQGRLIIGTWCRFDVDWLTGISLLYGLISWYWVNCDFYFDWAKSKELGCGSENGLGVILSSASVCVYWGTPHKYKSSRAVCAFELYVSYVFRMTNFFVISNQYHLPACVVRKRNDFCFLANSIWRWLRLG